MSQIKYVSPDKLLYFKQLMAQLITNTANTKVDKVDGKGLSTNDYTTAEKSKLSGIAAGAQVNVIEGIQVNGVTQTPTGKVVNISVPTDYITNAALASALTPYAKTADLPTRVSQFENDSEYQTASDVTSTLTPYAKKTELPTKVSQLTNDSEFQTKTQVSTAISEAVGQIVTFDFQIVEALPSSGEGCHIYLVPKKTAQSNSVYDEYAWINSKWELIGTTEVDLTPYVKTEDLVEITNAEIDAMFA